MMVNFSIKFPINKSVGINSVNCNNINKKNLLYVKKITLFAFSWSEKNFACGMLKLDSFWVCMVYTHTPSQSHSHSLRSIGVFLHIIVERIDQVRTLTFFTKNTILLFIFFSHNCFSVCYGQFVNITPNPPTCICSIASWLSPSVISANF